MPERQILATSGGMTSTPQGEPRLGPLMRHALALSGAKRPRICFLNTAGGDDPASYFRCYAAAAAADVTASHLALFTMPNVSDLRDHLLAQDVIWVGGGSVANLLAVWRVHRLDELLGEAWEAGVVLSGVSAGSICWHLGGTTDSFGPELRPVHDGLGLLPYANGVHYDSEPGRRPLLQALVASGELPHAYATDDGAGLHYVGTELAEAVCEAEGQFGWEVVADGKGGALETRLPTRTLG